MIISKSVALFNALNSGLQTRNWLISARRISRFQFENIADETLESLHEYFDDLLVNCDSLPNADTICNNGVLTVFLDLNFGTYVINKQVPNAQIWLSSPTSGPKRYDYIENKDAWIYRRDNQSLHQLLQFELIRILGNHTDFFTCKHSGHPSN